MKHTVRRYKEGEEVPKQFCHMLERKTDRQWIVEIAETELLDVEKFGKSMLRALLMTACYQLTIEGDRDAVEADYEASIYIEGNKVNEHCWSSWGFWIEQKER